MITKWLKPSAFIVAAFLLLVTPAFAAEQIDDWQSDITVNQDGSFVVEETIRYDFDTQSRHGIYRTIPLTHSQPASTWYKKRRIEIDVAAVTIDGQNVPYEELLSQSGLTIKIGDPKVTISGEHEYQIRYLVWGGLSYFDNHSPDLYWNVTGHDWDIPIKAVTVKVAKSYLIKDERACYRGVVGQTNSCTSYATSTAMVYSTGTLYPGEGITIAQSLSPQVAKQILEQTKNYYFWVPLLALFLLTIGTILYRLKTKHKPNTTIIAQYEPYPEALPMYSGVLFDGRLDARDITAGLLYLAQQGFIKIHKTNQKVLYLFETDDYEVELIQTPASVPTHFHEVILGLLFSNLTVGERVILSSLKGDTTKQRSNYRAVQKLKTAVAADVLERGFYEKVTGLKYLVLAGAVLAGIFIALAVFVDRSWGALVMVTLSLGLVALAVVYRRRTALGYQTRNHLLGFKEFLSVTDKERFKFHDAPSKNPEQFLEYLPYAVALGVEREWAAVFADVTIPNPDWYDGGNIGTFSAVALSRDLGAFSTSFSGSSVSSPSSGGGSSGGGSGGGGGGSW